MNKEEVLRLAGLARIEVSENEAEKLSHEFENILGYVAEVKNASGGASVPTPADYALKNVLREDTNPHESGIYTEKLLAEAPNREGDFVKVKKIL